MNTLSEPSLHPRGHRSFRAWPFLFALALWVTWFWPILLQHKNLMGYHLLDPRTTGAPLSLVPEKEGLWPIREDTSLHMMFMPYKMFLARQFHSGHFPLWNPEMACGQPVAADPVYEPFSPFFLPFMIAPSAWMFSIGIALHAFFGILGFALFWRERGLDWSPAVLGGSLMALNPLTVQTLVVSNSWGLWSLGWAFWGCERVVRRRSHGGAILACGIGLVVLTGHIVVGLFQVIMLTAYGWCSDSASPALSKMNRWVVIGLLSFALSAVTVLPFIASLHTVWTYKDLWNGGPYLPWWFLADPKSTVYIPLPVWSLAGLGFMNSRKAGRWIFLGITLVGLLIMAPWVIQGPIRWFLSLGGYLVGAYGEEWVRFGITGLAVIGLSLYFGGTPVRAMRRSLQGLAGGAGLGLLIAWLASVHTFEDFAYVQHRGVALVELVCEALLVVGWMTGAHRWARSTSLAAGSLIILLPLVLPFSLWRLCTETDLTRPETAPEVVRAISAGGGASGSWRFSGEYLRRADDMPDLSPNQGLNWGLSDVRTNSPMVLNSYAQFARHWQIPGLGQSQWLPRQGAEVLAFLGARWIVRDSVRPPLKEWIKRRPTRRELRPSSLIVEQIPSAQAWVRTVGGWEAIPDVERQLVKTYQLIDSGAWRSKAVIEGDRCSSETTPASWIAPALSWIEGGPNEWGWEVCGKDRSLLLVLQNFHSGWRCNLDGKEAPILRTYGSFMGVMVPPGAHRVHLRYHDPWFAFGALLSALAWVVVPTWALFGYLVHRVSTAQGAE